LSGYLRPTWITLNGGKGKINTVSAESDNGTRTFNDYEFLYKPVENKSLAKEFKKQNFRFSTEKF
jgi:hypothetical protein